MYKVQFKNAFTSIEKKAQVSQRDIPQRVDFTDYSMTMQKDDTRYIDIDQIH